MLQINVSAIGDTVEEILKEAEDLHDRTKCNLKVIYNDYCFKYPLLSSREEFIASYNSYKKAKDKRERNEYLHGR